GVAARMTEHAKLAVLCVLVLSVGVRVAKEEVSTFANPNRALGELKAFRQFEDFRIWTDDLVDRGVFANHLDIHFTGRDRYRAAHAPVEIELRQPHPDEIGRRVGERPVGAEDRKLDNLPRLHVAPDDQAIRSVPAGDDGAAALADGTG